MLAVFYLGAVVLPLVLGIVAIGMRVARALTVSAEGPPAEVAELHPTVEEPEPVELPAPVELRPPAELPPCAATAPGRLQLVDEDIPSTKVCPDCAETVLGAARVCRHCHFRFAPPLAGSWAV